jgi:hypothetical protein
MHQEPEQMHKLEVLVNHFIELIAPFFILVPFSRRCRMIGGCLQILFQVSAPLPRAKVSFEISWSFEEILK